MNLSAPSPQFKQKLSLENFDKAWVPPLTACRPANTASTGFPEYYPDAYHLHCSYYRFAQGNFQTYGQFFRIENNDYI